MSLIITFAIISITAIVCKSKRFEYTTDDDKVSYTVDIGDTETTITIEGDDANIWYGIAFGGATFGAYGAKMEGAYGYVL